MGAGLGLRLGAISASGTPNPSPNANPNPEDLVRLHYAMDENLADWVMSRARSAARVSWGWD